MNKVYYPLKLTESQLLRYLNVYKVDKKNVFDTSKDLVEITCAIYAKKRLENKYKTKFLIGFEMKQSIKGLPLNPNKPDELKKLLSYREEHTLIDFMIIPTDNPNKGKAFAFQLKRFYPKDNNPEGSLIEAINSNLKLKLSQNISLVLVPDSPKAMSVKINLKNVMEKIHSNTNSYEKIFILHSDKLTELKAAK